MTETATISELVRQAESAVPVPPPEMGTKFTALEGALADIFNLHNRARRESGVQDQMINALYMFHRTYRDDKLTQLQSSGMSTVYLGLCQEKGLDAIAWLGDVFLKESDKPWRLKPTPKPNVPPGMVQRALARGIAIGQKFLGAAGQEADQDKTAQATDLVRQEIETTVQVQAERATKDLERAIQDKMVEGGYVSAMQDIIFDLVMNKVAILKGPVLRQRKRRTWSASGDRATVKYSWQPCETMTRVSPFDAYPAPSAVGFEGDFVERTRYSLQDLFWMRQQKHFFKDQVEYLINTFGSFAGGTVRDVDSQLAPILRGQTGENKVQGTLEGLEFWLTVTGKWLKAAGWSALPTGNQVDSDKLYYIEAITVEGRLVYLGENPSPVGEKPYSKAGWVPVPGSFWYRSLMEVLEDLQEIANAAARSLVNNMGLASGFQVIIPDISRLLSGAVTTIFPHKIWQFKNPGNSAAPPISFQQPDSNAQELLGIINECRQQADSRSGVPKYLLGGEPPPGVGRTASGISMLMNSAAKGIRRVVISMDLTLVCGFLRRMYEREVISGNVSAALGDIEIVPSGAVETLIKSELAERRLGLLDAITKAGPDAELIGPRGRAELWREVYRSAELDGSAMIDSVEKIEQREESREELMRKQEEAKTQALQAEAQAKQTDAAVAQAKLEVEKQRLAMETQILRLKLLSQIEESKQRAAITRRMAANTDLKTAQELGQTGVPAEGEIDESVDLGIERPGPVEGQPGIPEAGVPVEGIPVGPESAADFGGGGAPEPMPGGGPVS